MDPKHLNEAQSLSRDAFKQATERFLESKRSACTCPLKHAFPASERLGHGPTCPAHVTKEAA